MGIAEDLRRHADTKRRLPEAADEYEWTFLVSAIAQHYGPGSRFLDVTRSVPVALCSPFISTRHLSAEA